MKEDCKKIADIIRNGIESYAQEAYDDGFRTHLGASLIGDTCRRKLWFTFRWVDHVKHTGRMYRLFNTGHMEEARIIGWLQGAGYKVENIDPATGRQYIISDVCGHFGGSIDGIVEVPGLGNCLLECKTSKCGAEFKTLFDNGVFAKDKHWSQVCTYGFKLGLTHALYICKNKCNDDLYIEPVELDWKHGEDMIRKAESVIFSEIPPPRESESKDFWKCKMCQFVAVCHSGKELARNCRSCTNCKPIENKQWHCHRFGIVPAEYIPSGCGSWESIY